MKDININNLQYLLNSPNAPVISKPSMKQQAELTGYWNAVLKNIEFVFSMQKLIPNWLPPFNPIY